MKRVMQWLLVLGFVVAFAVGCASQQQPAPATGTAGAPTAGSGGGRAQPQTLATVTLVNQSNAPIYYVYMSSSTDQSWGDDLLGTRVLEPNQSLNLSNVNPGVWDIRVVDRDGLWKEFYQQQVNPGGVHQLIITGDEWNQQFR